jgi:hypothetical protein
LGGKKWKAENMIEDLNPPKLGIRLSPENAKAIDEWSSSILNPTVPGRLLERSVIKEVSDEGAKLLSATFMYGERTGRQREIPYDESEITNKITDLATETLWIYGADGLNIPSDFTTTCTTKSFYITTGKVHKCSECRGFGKVTCSLCKGKIRWTERSGDTVTNHNCSCGDGKEICSQCDGYSYTQTVIDCDTSYKLHTTNRQDYKGEIPKDKLAKTTGTELFDESVDYPEEKMTRMLRGGLNGTEYAELQSEVAGRFHVSVDEKLTAYDGDRQFIHNLITEFFSAMPNAVEKNKLLEYEILPIRLKLKIEDSPVKRITYEYKQRPYKLWVYGNEKRIFASEKPFEFTPRLIGIILFFAAIVAAVIYKSR